MHDSDMTVHDYPCMANLCAWADLWAGHNIYLAPWVDENNIIYIDLKC